LLVIAATAPGCSEQAAENRALVVSQFELPAPTGSQFPDISLTPQGDVLLSWIQADDTERHALEFAVHADGRWQQPQRVATGDNWFVNWADFPSVRALANGLWAAHWLVRQPAGGYAYDVAVAISGDSGDTWTSRITPYNDTSASEHGFVSLFGSAPERVELVWLDGRRSAGPDGEMQLMAASLAPDGTVLSENVVDQRACDCCQTDVALVENDWLVAFRDRSAGEIRDIRLARKSGVEWQQLGKPSDDGFEFSACPVNGPAIAAANDAVVVSWWLLDQRRPVVRVARSDDAGNTFAVVRDLATGSLPGRVDTVMLPNGDAAVSWMSREEEIITIKLAILDPGLAEKRRVNVATVARSRESGFPRMVLVDSAIILVWTDPEAGGIRGARVSL
jgi:hypothetical protein